MATYIKTTSSGNVEYEIEPGNENVMLPNEQQGGGEPEGYSDVVQSISNNYSSESTYNAGDIVFYENKLYQAMEDITTAETWTPEHWQQITLSDEITDLKDEVSEAVPMVYEVGAGKEYTSFTACLKALQGNSKNKTILVYDGTYDIFEELGGADYASTIEVNSNWRDVNVIVPPNTKIIGVGNVIFEFLPADDEIATPAINALSVLNVVGNVEIENIKIHAQNCLYLIRDDTSSLPGLYDVRRKFKNVECIRYNGGTHCYSCTFKQGAKISFENCHFESYSGTTFGMVSVATGNATINIVNSVFLTNASVPDIALVNTNAIAQRNIINICGCHLQANNAPKKISVIAGGQNVVNGYDVTLIGCSDIGNTTIDIAGNIYPIKQYNAIS